MIDALMNYGLSYSAACAVVVTLLILMPILALRAVIGFIFGLFE